MKKIQQSFRHWRTLLLKPYFLHRSLCSRSMQALSALAIVWIGSQGCSKNDIGNESENPRTSFVQFLLFSTKDHSSPEEANTALKIQLTVSRMDATQTSKTVLWDTLITRNRIVDLGDDPKLPSLQVQTAVTSKPTDKLLLAYKILYNKNGEITTESGNLPVNATDNKKYSVRIGK